VGHVWLRNRAIHHLTSGALGRTKVIEANDEDLTLSRQGGSPLRHCPSAPSTGSARDKLMTITTKALVSGQKCSNEIRVLDYLGTRDKKDPHGDAFTWIRREHI
jgi:hypothetical protein